MDFTTSNRQIVRMHPCSFPAFLALCLSNKKRPSYFNLHIYTQVHAHPVNTQPKISQLSKYWETFLNPKSNKMEISELIGK